ncbi:MAG: Hint domain-containing protein, partial [Methanomassiliicoccales archaeon]
MSKPVIIQTADLENTFKALRLGDPMSLQRGVPSSPDYKSVPSRNYAPTSSVNTGSWGAGSSQMHRSASGASGIIYGQPQFFSPVHTPINWQIPSKRLEEYQWARFFYKNEPKVASSIDFYSYFPINDYEHECKDRKIKRYFDDFKMRLQIVKWLRLVSHEIHLLGDCFPFLEISCPQCGGVGRVGDQLCEHEGGTVKRIVILNPDFVEVFTSPLNPEPIVALKPDEELINMVQKRTPGYERLTAEVIKLISAGLPIRLDNRNVSHLMYGEGGYTRYGTGMVRRLFPILSYKTKLMVAQWIVAERLIVPIKIVKVGSDERPAGPADIAAVQQQLAMTANDPNLTIVTHHAFELDWQGACHSEDTEVLTENGWKKYSDVSKNYDEKIATYNVITGNIEYDSPQAYHEYDYAGQMVTFDGKHYSCKVTPNHKMLVSERKWDNDNLKYIHSEWNTCRADQVIENARFKTTAGWKGEIPENLPCANEYLLGNMSLDNYLEFIGYYLSEGGLKVDNGTINAIHLTQKENGKCFDKIKQSAYNVRSKIQELEDKRDDPSVWQFIINDSKLAREIAQNYGDKCC